MVFGHHFNFQDEPSLQEEFYLYLSDPTSCNDSRVVDVLETVDSSPSDTFPLKSDWCAMSGQMARYYSTISFEKAGENFSWALEIKDAVALVWDALSHRILYLKGKNYTPQRLRFWIYHTFFPLVLEIQRKYRILHVGSVEIDGNPVLFSAFSYGGKSTLTDYFIQKGHIMLSDDSLAIEKQGDHYYGIPSYPFHRPYRELETLGCHIDNFAAEPKPIQAIYLLKKSEPDASVNITELNGIEKFKAFHYSAFIDFDFMKRERFDYFTKMAKHIPVYQITIPWNTVRLKEVYGTIVEQSRKLSDSSD